MAYKKITIGDMEMEFKGSAATPVIFHRVFKIDLITRLRKWEKRAEKAAEKAAKKAKKEKDKTNSNEQPKKEEILAEIEIEESEESSTIDLISKLGFVMAMQAEKRSMSELGKLNEDSYLEWLDRFDNVSDLPFDDIMSVYYNNVDSDPEVEEKNESAEPSEN